MSRVLLVNPPFYRSLGSHYNGLSLGMGYLASYLNYYGHDAWTYNADFVPTIAYKTPHRIYDDSRVANNSAAGVVADTIMAWECVRSIVAFRPDIVGYSCYTATIPMVDRISRGLRKVMPDVLQVVGGAHATMDGSICRLLPAVDVVVTGEGEAELESLAAWGLDGRQRSIRIKRLDDNPYPERDKLWSRDGRPMVARERAMTDVSSLITARGCPWRCTYCASQSIWPTVVARGVESIVREVAWIADAYPGRPLHFVDDTFTYSERRALAIMQGILDLGMPLTWRCEARADTITPAVADAMGASGCIRVKIGVESGSERILKAMHKGETLDDMRRAVALLHGVGIPVTAYLMTGFPGETDDDLRRTIDFARELGADTYSVSMCTPYFGTPLYRDALAGGLAIDKAPWDCFFHQHRAMLLNHELSPGLLDELWTLSDG